MIKQIATWIDKEYKPKLVKEYGLPQPESVSGEIINAIERWANIYQDKAEWLEEGKAHSLNLAASIAGEFARLTTLEMVSEVTGETPRAQYLGAQYTQALAPIRDVVEYAAATGGMIAKPYYSGGDIGIEYVPADAFLPIGFDMSGRVNAAVFMQEVRRGKTVMRRYECHVMTSQGPRVLNFAYQSSGQGGTETRMALGSHEPWADIIEDASFYGIDFPLFGYFRVPGANIIAPRSHIGASVFAKAVNHIKEADEQWARISWEFAAKEAAIDVNETMLKRGADGKASLPQGKDRLYRRYAVDTGINDKAFYEVYSPNIREQSYFYALNEIKREIERDCSLSFGTLSNVNNVEKTASEIKASKQRSYAAVSDMQKKLQFCLTDAVRAMDATATFYGLAPRGDYGMRFEWDDSIIVDTAEEGAVRMQEVAAGLIRPEVYLAWRYGVSEEAAQAMMPQEATYDPAPIDEE